MRNNEFGYVQRRVRKTSIDETRVRRAPNTLTGMLEPVKGNQSLTMSHLHSHGSAQQNSPLK